MHVDFIAILKIVYTANLSHMVIVQIRKYIIPVHQIKATVHMFSTKVIPQPIQNGSATQKWEGKHQLRNNDLKHGKDGSVSGCGRGLHLFIIRWPF